MQIRAYTSKDCRETAALFHNTVHTVNAKDYTLPQRQAWAPEEMDLAQWDRSLLAHDARVAVADGQIVGFGDMTADGYLDRLYVSAAHQGEGIGTGLCDALEGAAAVSCFTTHASCTARSFFEKRGYRIVRTQQVERQGVCLTNYVMVKQPHSGLVDEDTAPAAGTCLFYHSGPDDAS